MRIGCNLNREVKGRYMYQRRDSAVVLKKTYRKENIAVLFDNFSYNLKLTT